MNFKKFASCFLACALSLTAFMVTPKTVSADDGVNLALNSSVRYSTRYGAGHTGEYLVDGDLKTSWATGSEVMDASLDKNSIIIDLDSVCNINKIILRSRRDIDQTYDRLGWEVYVSETADFKNQTYLGKKATAGNHMEDFEIALKTPVKARYVKIYRPNGGAMVIAEAEVYGNVVESGNVLNSFSDIESADAVNLVSYLNILGGESKTTFNPGKLIKRGEAAEIVLRLINHQQRTSNMYFTDVTSEHQNFGAVSTCYEMGIISKADHFNPDEYITVMQFYSMVTKALDYSLYIDRTGGYPNGILNVVRQLKLDKGVKIGLNDGLNKETAVEILYNALAACPLMLLSWNGEGTELDFSKSEPALSVYYHMELKSGVVTQNNETTLTAATTQPKNSIKVNGESYSDLGGTLWKYVGKDIHFLIHKDNPAEIQVGWENTRYTQTKVIAAEDVVELSKTQITYYADEEKHKKETVDLETPVVLKNGVFFANHGYDKESLCLPGATLEVIDNNDDRQAEVVNILLPKYIPLEAASYSEMDTTILLTDKNGEVTKLIDFENLHFSIDGTETKPKILPSAKFAVLYASENGKNVDIKAYSALSTGTVTEIGANTVTVDGTVLKLSDYYSKNKANMGDVAVSKNITYFAENGALIWVSNEETFETNIDAYGVISNMYFTGNSLDRELSVKIFNSDGKFTTNKVKEEVTVDGKRMKIDEIYDVARTDFLYKFVLYRVNANGEITFMDTENYHAATEPDSHLKVMEDNLSDAIYANGVVYRGTTMLFATDADLKVFNVPYVSNGEILGDNYDSYYKVSTRNSVLTGNVKVGSNLRFYAIDDDKIAGFAMRRTSIPYSEKEYKPTSSNTGPILLVEKVTKATNAEGSVCNKLTGFDIVSGTQYACVTDENLTKVVEFTKVPDDLRTEYDLVRNTNLDNGYLSDFSTIKPGDLVKVDILANTIYAADMMVRKNSLDGIYSLWGRNTPTVYSESKLVSVECLKITKGYLVMNTAEDAENTLLTPYKDFSKLYVVHENGTVDALSSSEIPNYAQQGRKGLAYYTSAKARALVLYE